MSEQNTTTANAGPPQAALRLRELGMGAAYAGMLRAAVLLGVADALADAPLTSDQLATACNAEPHTLRRLLRALITHDVFARADDDGGQERYLHTPMSRLLRRDHAHSMADMVLWGTAAWTWQAWPMLEQAVRTGKAVIPELFGKEFFAYLKEDAPADAAVFNGAMTQASALTTIAIAEALDMSGVDRVVDVGGGQGHLLAALLRRHPELRGVLFEQAHVVGAALSELSTGDLADRVEVTAGDGLVSVPVDADLYVIKQILKWDDDSSVATLRNVREAARPGARVAVVQGVLDAGDDLRYATAMDLFVLLNVGGQEHTRGEFIELFARAGLVYRGIIPTRSQLFIIEAVVPGDSS